MKRLILALALLITLLVPVVAAENVAAVSIFRNCGSGSADGAPGVCQDAKNPGTTNPIIQTLKITINVLSLVVGVAAVIAIVLSGLRMILANGDSNSISSARSGLLYALVGLAVVALAQSIVIFVLDRIK